MALDRTKLLAALVLATFLLIATTPSTAVAATTSCKTSLLKYDHRTGFITWFTVYNEMRFCYDGHTARRIEWTNNRTSSPTPPYSRGTVSTTAVLETEAGVKRARNVSIHEINCLKVVNGFDVTMRQFGYGSGKVTTYRSPISSSSDC